jgi:Fe-S-cluster-containing dehydrogenase component/formate-dependent nitrite reductase membrane component NrfD
MRYGFAIDQRSCIGCHACTVACKTEHEVPLGQFRTWVKYVEKGEFPATTRAFGVLRCNHCTDAPCVRICPTKALFKRDDGIVDFDRDRCIGCKSCLQACPYDAIYIDADTHTAAKCNFCAHRIDQDLEPACVVVCPTHSIWVGDLDDATSGISRLVAGHPTSVRAPEQNTGPNVFYLGADRAVLEPLDAPVDKTYLWASPDPHRLATSAELSGDAAAGAARTTYNTAHPRPWGWRVTTYLWTKGLSAGALLVAALAHVLGADLGLLGTVVAPAVALGFLAVTGGLLILDLKRPERFLYIFGKPNPTSWLFWGSVALAVHGAVAAGWLLLGIAAETGRYDADTAFGVLRWLAVPAAALAAGYTGFLFGQAEGRDLWQSPLLFWHLQVQAVLVGAGALALALPFVEVGGDGDRLVVRTLVLAAAGHVLMLALEYAGRHPTRHAAAAARLVTRGRYARTFWLAAIGGAAVAAALASLSWTGDRLAAALGAGLLVQPALLAYESVFVRAGQDVPLS